MPKGEGALSLKPPVFDGKGFFRWKETMKTYLLLEDCLTIVEGTEAKPEVKKPGDKSEEAAVKDWTRRDDKAVAIIGMSLATPILMDAEVDMGSELLWKWLEIKFSRKQGAEIMQLYTEVINMRFVGGELRQHMDRMEEVFDELSFCPDYAITAGLQKLFLYRSLPHEWQSFVNFLLMEPKLTWSEVRKMLLQKESRMKPGSMRTRG